MTQDGAARDWTSDHQRMNASSQALARAFEQSPAEVEAIRKRRAAYLASRSRTDAKAKRLEVLIFVVASERFAVELGDLKEISGAVTCTPVPGMLDKLLGLANLHGEIRPVLDPASLLGVPRKGAINRTPGAILYLRWGQKEVGIGADHLEGLSKLDQTKLQAAAQDGAGMPRRFIKAITPETLALIDVPALLAGMGIGEVETNESMQEGKRA